MFPALQHRNFRLLWLGLLVSFTGTFMQTAAILWHVSLLAPDDTRALALGLVGLVRVVPVIAFSLLSGVAADALDRRRLMLVTQSTMACLALVLATLTFRGLSSLWPIYLLAACSSAAGAFDLPARQSLTPNLVPREHLPNAITLNTIMVQVASVAGPALGGVVIATGGVAWVYAFNAASFLVVIGALLMMRMPQAGPGRRGRRRRHPRQLHRRRRARGAAVRVSRAAHPLDDAPGFLRDVLLVGDGAAADLRAGRAARGRARLRLAVCGARRRRRPRQRVDDSWRRLDRASRARAARRASRSMARRRSRFGVSRAFWLTFGCLAATGAADTVSMVFRNLIRQLETPDRLRGRMVGVNMVFFMGGPQLGELEAGLVANAMGPTVAVVTGGIGCLIATAWVAARTPALRAYRRTVVPDVVDDVVA